MRFRDLFGVMILIDTLRDISFGRGILLPSLLRSGMCHVVRCGGLSLSPTHNNNMKRRKTSIHFVLYFNKQHIFFFFADNFGHPSMKQRSIRQGQAEVFANAHYMYVSFRTDDSHRYIHDRHTVYTVHTR